MSQGAFDRVQKLAEQDKYLGLDFVYVNDDQKTLFLFFLPSKLSLISGPNIQQMNVAPSEWIVAASQITITSAQADDNLPSVALDPASPPRWASIDNTGGSFQLPDWATPKGRAILVIKTIQPGDFSRYVLRLNHPKIDAYFNKVEFSFKANCPSDLDCAPNADDCSALDALVDFPVNYSARDFWSIRQALIDFASIKHPAWQDRLEADLGMMLLEVMSAMGDEFAYYQDRVSREAYFETATQRRSVRRLARLVDYEMHDGVGGTTWLDFQIKSHLDNDPASAVIQEVVVGTPVWIIPGIAKQGELARDRRNRSASVFEVGYGLQQGNGLLSSRLDVLPTLRSRFVTTNAEGFSCFRLNNRINALAAYQWDANEMCLPANSTSLHVVGSVKDDLILDDYTNPDVPGKWAVLMTNPNDASIPARSWRVRIVAVKEEFDVLAGIGLTRIDWEQAQATPYGLEFETLTVHGNIVPATAGETLEAHFKTAPPPTIETVPGKPTISVNDSNNPYYTDIYSRYTIERQAPSTTELVAETGVEPYRPSLLFSIPGTEQLDLVMRGIDAQSASPEVRLLEASTNTEWEWQRSLLGVNSSTADQSHFTLDDGTWRRAVGYRRVDESGVAVDFVHYDYTSPLGFTIRFGNGEFGKTPDPETEFRLVYRLGHGRSDNVSTGSLTDFAGAKGTDKNDLTESVLSNVLTVSNPFDVSDAVDPETAEHAKMVAPEAFRGDTLRAVRSEDYETAAEKLSWVQRASAQFRWTGSWLTLFATADPKQSSMLSSTNRLSLEQQLDRYRLAGRETHALDPRYVNLDLTITVCVAPTSYRGNVEKSVLDTLFGGISRSGKLPFFSPDNWTFGDSLELAPLQAVIQAVPGVKAVETITIQRRGWPDTVTADALVYSVAKDEVIRIENDNTHPDRGRVHLIMEGGA